MPCGVRLSYWKQSTSGLFASAFLMYFCSHPLLLSQALAFLHLVSVSQTVLQYLPQDECT